MMRRRFPASVVAAEVCAAALGPGAQRTAVAEEALRDALDAFDPLDLERIAAVAEAGREATEGPCGAKAALADAVAGILDADVPEVAAPEPRRNTPRPSSPKPVMAILCDVACDIVAGGVKATPAGLRAELERHGRLREKPQKRGGAIYHVDDQETLAEDFRQAVHRANEWGRVNGLVNGRQRASTA